MIQTTAVFATTVDGKISAVDRKAHREPDKADQAHVEFQASLADLYLLGAGTLRSEGGTLLIRNPELLAMRAARNQSPQPITCIVSQSLRIPTDLSFFSQPIERWIFTTEASLKAAAGSPLLNLAEVIPVGEQEIDWDYGYAVLAERGIKQVAALGGGSLNADLLKAKKLDMMWVTIWPTLFGGKEAPTAIEGDGYDPKQAPILELLETRQISSELFLQYRIHYRDKSG
ncbi:MAG: dihydrofolate reductase family protein [Anaerolineae bacterium]|nr:dihydrofolate reductase family protein [Gloeobacterales cyanobacterium ES-bin-313]